MEIKNFAPLTLPNELPELKRVPSELQQLPSDSFVRAGKSLSEIGDKLKQFALSKAMKILDHPVLTTVKPFNTKDRDFILENIRPGDIILETDATTPSWGIMEEFAGGGEYTHAAIYEGDGKFLEATTEAPTGKGVVRSDLKEYLSGRLRLEVIRPNYQSKEDIDAALNYARSQIGKPYDSEFDYSSDEKQYCSELVSKALASMPHKIEVPSVTVKGKKAVLPVSFRYLPDSEKIYSDNNSFAKTLLHSSPGLAGGVAMAVAGGVLLGPVAAVGGLLLGTVATSWIGGDIQAKIDAK